jgi:3-hydroxybutyryl-CoA dehydrogenase
MDPVAVLGTGTMAPGIAIAFAEAGHPTSLWGRDPDAAPAAIARAGEMAGALESAGLGGAVDEVMSRISAEHRLEGIASRATLVVEAISEDLGAKQGLFESLDAICAPEVLLATNTSGLRVTDIAAGATRRERIVAMHFWNPAHLMPIVEVAGGVDTAEDSVSRASAFASQIGKLPVVLTREVLGFLGTRMQQAVVREAIALLQAGVASAADIDLAVRASFGVRFPAIGPLESADLSGLDVIEAIHRYLLPDLDRSTEPQTSLSDRVQKRDLGIKTGRGFHEWSSDHAAEVVQRRDQELVRRIEQLAADGIISIPGSERA